MIMPHYYVETEGGSECTSFVMYSSARGAFTILECHEYDAMVIAALLNKSDPDGEAFLGQGIDRYVDNEHLLI